MEGSNYVNAVNPTINRVLPPPYLRRSKRPTTARNNNFPQPRDPRKSRRISRVRSFPRVSRKQNRAISILYISLSFFFLAFCSNFEGERDR